MKKITFLALGFALCFGVHAQLNTTTLQRGAALPFNTKEVAQPKAASTWYPEGIRDSQEPMDSLYGFYSDQTTGAPIGTILAGQMGAFATPTFSSEVTVKGAVLYYKFINNALMEGFNVATLEPSKGAIGYTLSLQNGQPVLEEIDGVAMANASINGSVTHTVNFATPTSCRTLTLLYIIPLPVDTTVEINQENILAKIPMFSLALAKADAPSADFQSGVIKSDMSMANYGCDVFFFPIIEGGTALTEVEKANMVRLFPNPAKNTVSIVSSFSMENYEVFNMMGQKVASAPADGENSTKINVSDLSSGNYIVKVYTDAGVIVKKIVVE